MKKLVNDEEVVFRYIDIDTGELSYELREEDSIRVDTRESKENPLQ